MCFSAVSGGPVTWQALEFLPRALCDSILLINCSPSALLSLVADTPVLFWISKPNNRTSLKVCLTKKQTLGETPWVKTRDFGTSFRVVRLLVTFPPFTTVQESEAVGGQGLGSRLPDLILPYSKNKPEPLTRLGNTGTQGSIQLEHLAI